MLTHDGARLVQKITAGIVLSGVLLDKFHIVPVGYKADILAVVLAGVDKMQLLRQGAHLGLSLVAKGELYMRQLFLTQHIQHIALALAVVYCLFQQPAPRCRIIRNARIMPGDHIVQPALPGKVQQLVKFHIAVAVNAWVGRTAVFIDADEFFDDLILEVRRKVQHFIGDIQLKRHLGGIVDVPLGTAGMKAPQPDILVAVQPHRCADAIIALLCHQVRSHRAVHAAAHGNQGGVFVCYGHFLTPLYCGRK